jgi:hypothetical protein
MRTGELAQEDRRSKKTISSQRQESLIIAVFVANAGNPQSLPYHQDLPSHILLNKIASRLVQSEIASICNKRTDNTV